jgi:hypothetical protein
MSVRDQEHPRRVQSGRKRERADARLNACRVYFAADPRLVEMAREISNEVNLLPPPMIIETERTRQRHVRVAKTMNPGSSSRCFGRQVSRAQSSILLETSPMQLSSIGRDGSSACTS